MYNKADCVLRTLWSVARQTDIDFELIVVDDGSTDPSATLVKAAGLPHLQLIEQPNAGVSAARNRGIRAAQGEWVAFLDADDLWSHDHLASLWRAADGSDAVAVFSNLRLESRAGSLLIDPNVSAQRIDDYFSFALSNGGYPVSSSSIMVRRDELLAAGPFAEGISTGEDIDMWCRLACRGSFIYSAAPSATYNDASSPSLCGSRDTISRPLFAERLSDLMRDHVVPTRLHESGRRYANFLMLEYARQLLDAGRYKEAQAVLLSDCIPGYDLSRFLKRLARTTIVGRTLFGLRQATASRA
ncbi:glycosyltransferase family 2 protein [Bradyrhizobium sp. ISRA435]|nr:glycosyltransferase family 2 protein [Bradyrhizobium sp. ISRA435]